MGLEWQENVNAICFDNAEKQQLAELGRWGKRRRQQISNTDFSTPNEEHLKPTTHIIKIVILTMTVTFQSPSFYYRHYSENHQTFGVEPTGSFLLVRHQWGLLPCWLSSKEAIYQGSEHGFNLWVGKLPLEKEMAIHSSILAWEIPWTEEPGGPQSMGVTKSLTRLGN